MPKRILAIATCRVSSVEQLESNSLNRQEESVKEAAIQLEVTIPTDGIWSGSVSSKSGSNYSRKDLKDMLSYCKKNPNVKYLIVDEIDRFMRSIDEMFYFEVLFREEVGVKVWYAQDPALNSDDPITKLRRAMEAFKGEGTNLERQIKSIKGQTFALKEGRYPFAPKPGYKRGYERGIQEIHSIRGPILRDVLIRITTRQIAPAKGLVELNSSEFMESHAPYKMDKFRKIVTDPFYAGIVEIDKQVKVRNENGLHEPLITREQHLELVKIMSDKAKNQSGPRKNGNPKYPCNNIVICDLCIDERIGRVVGFNHSNGKPNGPIYEKYRCRACNRYVTRQELHVQVEQQFKDSSITQEGLEDLREALNTVWKQREGQAEQEANRIRHKINTANETIFNKIEAVTDPNYASVKDEIMASIAKKKDEVAELEVKLEGLKNEADTDRERFLQFAFNFVENMGSKFLEISPENRLRCKDIVFPAGFYLDKDKNVYTPEISLLFRLATIKKDAKASPNSHLVRVRGL